jgi:hypothetical protein
MIKHLLALLTAGLLVFSSLNCASSVRAASEVPAGLAVPGVPDGNYLTMSVKEVITLLGNPTQSAPCTITLPTADGEKRVAGDGAVFTREGYQQEENYYIIIRTDLCAVFGIVVAQSTRISVSTSDYDSTLVQGYVDFPLVRQLLLDGPNRDGVEDGVYVPKPGEMSI